MENATKALLIAGSILIVIIIIGFGVLIVNSGDGMADQAGAAIDELEMQQFNSQLVGYEGTINASKMNALIEKIETMNVGKTADGDYDYVHLILNGTEMVTGGAKSLISSGKHYTVVLTKDLEYGIYTTVTVTEK